MQKQQRNLQKLTHVSFLLLLVAGLNSAELSRQGSRLAENLGMLLGLPLDMEVPRTNASTVPQFLMDVYNCWTNLGPNPDRASCLPVSDRAAKNLEDVNVVRGIKGTGTCIGHRFQSRTVHADNYTWCLG